jgi:hypothetical protein
VTNLPLRGGRRWVLTVAVLVVGGVLITLPSRSAEPVRDRPPKPGLEARIQDFAAALAEDAAYEPPDERERRAFTTAFARLGADHRAALADLDALGLDTERDTDPDTGRPYAAAAERGWGFYVVDLSRPTRIVVQVPHPANDLRTDEMGIELFRRMPGAVLAVAGTHRRAANGAGDVAHRTDTAFHALADDQARRGLPQVQLHGFGDDSLPGVDVVLSAGATEPTAALERIADGLDDDMPVCRTWARDCGELEGRRNKQGEAAARYGTAFLHIEVSRSAREDPVLRRRILREISDVLGER